jgi:NAD(P)-dependent dehydrogenase (short-subunit alcohol dehydrogenase family)
MKILVIGGTGLIGSRIVERLKRKGHEAFAAAPSTGVDTITGKGLAEALAGPKPSWMWRIRPHSRISRLWISSRPAART